MDRRKQTHMVYALELAMLGGGCCLAFLLSPVEERAGIMRSCIGASVAILGLTSVYFKQMKE